MAFKQSSRRRKRSSGSGWSILKGWKSLSHALQIPLVIGLLLMGYSSVSWIVKHYNPVKTVPAVQITLDDSFPASGYFFREEKLIDVSGSNTVEYNFSNGDKVAKDAALITEYQDEETLEISRQLTGLRGSIEQLKVLRNVSASSQNSSQIKQKIIAQMNAVSAEAERPRQSQVNAVVTQLRQLSLKSASIEGDSANIDKEIEDLEAQAEKMEQQLVGKTTEITSPYSGYFCESTDGFETVFTPDKLEKLDIEGLEKLAESGKKTETGKGKIITGYNWYFASVVDRTYAQNLEKGSSVVLRFPQISQDIRAEVYAVRSSEEDDRVLLIFQSHDMHEELASMRRQVATVVGASYTGLKVPKEAVRMKDDETGVYVLNNKVSSFKKVEILFEKDDYYIVRQMVTGNDSLVVSEDIIVKAKNVKDKKVVK